MENFLKDHKALFRIDPGIKVLVCLISVLWFYGCVNFHLSAFNNFAFFSPEDTADFHQSTWNTSQGRFLQYNRRDSEERIFEHKTLNYLHIHSMFILGFLALFYLILPHLSTFIIIQTLSIAAGGVVFYFVAREISYEKRFLPFLLFLLYFMYHPLNSISHFIHPEAFGILFSFLALYFYLKVKIGFTILFAIVSFFCREEYAFVFAMLGVISYFIPDKRKFFLPLLVSSVIFYFAFQAAALLIFKEPIGTFKNHFGYLGKAPGEVLHNSVFHPRLWIENAMRKDRIELFSGIFGSLYYLPFLSPLLLFPGLPIVGEFMFSQQPFMGTLHWQCWYLCPLIPFVFLSLAASFRKAGLLEARLGKPAAIFISGLLLFSLGVWHAFMSGKEYKEFLYPMHINRPHFADTFNALSGISEKARVISPYRFIYFLSSRERVAQLNFASERVVKQGYFDLILAPEEYKGPRLEDFSYIEKSGLYAKVFTSPYLTMYLKRGSGGLIKNWRLDTISELNGSRAAGNYLFTNFWDYQVILENSGFDPEQLVLKAYQDTQNIYAMFNPAREIKPGELYFSLDKHFEPGNYILAFAARSKNPVSSLYFKGALGEGNIYTECLLDNKMRLFVYPFQVRSRRDSEKIWMLVTNLEEVVNPLIFKRAAFEVVINGSRLSYEPWLDVKNIPVQSQALIRRLKDPYNPIVIFMQLIHLPIPFDFYEQTWFNSAVRGQLVAVKY